MPFLAPKELYISMHFYRIFDCQFIHPVKDFSFLWFNWGPSPLLWLKKLRLAVSFSLDLLVIWIFQKHVTLSLWSVIYQIVDSFLFDWLAFIFPKIHF